MERKGFLRSLVVGVASTSFLAQACKKDTVTPDSTGTTTTGTTTTGTTTSGTSAGTSTAAGGCTVAPTETEGPFPTKAPASYVRSDITDGSTGYKMTVKLIITNSSCNSLTNAMVDIWHCDSAGNYSEYGGTGMQATNYTAVHFLRGRQTTDANGLVTYTSIFPGWYSGRATHIHVHVYNSAGTSLKVTQVAFPEGAGSAVAAVNGYTKGLTGYTTNATDNVFSDGYAAETAAVTGNTTDGFVLTMSIAVTA
jgi:protocatechuate 3,4-dioxygenase beta subunit